MTTPLITRKGYETLRNELDNLWRVKRPEVTKMVTWAASLGDRSENADYQYNKKRLREIDRRVRYLQKRLESLKIIDFHPDQEGKVYFGAWVVISNDLGETKQFKIAGYDEIFICKDYISIDSPTDNGVRSCIITLSCFSATHIFPLLRLGTVLQSP
jgi:transcription elongation factor GreB